MTDRELATALQQIRKAAGRAEGGVSDAHLLERFVANGDEAAFELLVRRHQALVFGVCRRVLQHVPDAEDAFQATFLLLARKANAIGRREALAGWLYKVAYRVALTARAGRAKRVARERPVAAAADVPQPPDPAVAPEGREVCAVVDDEVSRLPERLRAAAALCYLEGKTVEEAAQQLGCPRGTVASRLARARQRLRVRLIRRGLGPPAGGALPVVGPVVQASEGLVRAARQCAAAGADIPAQVVELTEEVTRTMFIKKMITAAVLVLVAGAFLFGGALALQIQAGGEEPRTQDTGRTARPSGEPRLVLVAQPMWHYPKPFEDYLGRLEQSDAVLVRSRISGSLQKTHFKAREIVNQDDLLIEVAPPETLRAEWDKASVEAAQKENRHKAMQNELKDAERLFASGVAPKKMVNQAAEKERMAAEALQVAQAALANVRRQLEDTKIRAPVAGRVGDLNISPQDRIEASSTILTTISPAGRIGVQFEMDERSLLLYRRRLVEGKIHPSGGPLYVGLADEDGFPHEATLTRFDGQVNSTRGTIGVYGSLPNPGGILLPGMSARVRIPFTKQRRTLVVADGVVQTEQGKSYVWVVGKGEVAERRDVKAGAREGRLRLIESGLRPDEWVITGGTEGLRPGERLEPRRPAAKE
jgi:RND family efflux transporter MFP subunit